MRMLPCVLLIACGGGEGGMVEGEPLIQSTLSAQFNNKPWTPMFGFGRDETNNFAMYVGAEKISCADEFEGKPRNGNYGATGVPKPLAIGTFASSTFNVIEVIDGQLDTQLSIGSVQITAASETEVSAVFAFDTTIEGGRYALNGAVTMLRCP